MSSLKKTNQKNTATSGLWPTLPSIFHGFSIWKSHVTTRYHVMHSVVDDWIPFNEYFIIPYFLWFAYIAAVILWFFFTNKEDYYRVCILLFTGMTFKSF